MSICADRQSMEALATCLPQNPLEPRARLTAMMAVWVQTHWKTHIQNVKRSSLFFEILYQADRPDITVMVDWALKINYLSIFIQLMKLFLHLLSLYHVNLKLPKVIESLCERLTLHRGYHHVTLHRSRLKEHPRKGPKVNFLPSVYIC